MNTRTLISSVLMVLALVVLTACGSEGPTVTSTPEIRSALDEVDDAIVDENHPAASQALKELNRLVIEARIDGVLTDERSDAILVAANELLGELRTSKPDEPDPDTVSPPATESEFDEDDGKPEKPDKTKGDDKPEKPDKDESDESPGNSENAPGHEDD